MNKLVLLLTSSLVIFVQSAAGRKNLIQQSHANDSVNLIEKVYLHVDRDIYYPGDDIWFKAYLIDAFDHLLTNHSRNLHVELISPDMKIISDRIIRIDSGLCNGDFRLPPDIKSGRYRIRAYTNYMRNFSYEFFFTKEITVIANEDPAESSGDVKYVKNNITLSFFPEGGSLLDNVASNVAFKEVDSRGSGCDVSGKIFSSAGNMVTAFRSTHHGMGSFFLRPLPDLKYYAVFRGPDSIDHRTDLPASFPKGVVLSALKNQNNELVVSIKTNPETLESITGHDLLLGISIRKEVVNTIPFRIKSPLTSFVVPSGYLPEGVAMLTLSTQEDLPLAERLVYIEREPPVKIKIETDKHHYTKREPVSLTISLKGDSSVEREGNVSLSVADESFSNNSAHFRRTIASWFLLESDIRGDVEAPSYYFDASNSDRLKDLDLLLLTQGWRDFSWKYDSANFLPEDGFTISGKLKRNYKSQLFKDYRVSIGIFGTANTQLLAVPSDSMGSFKLSGIDLTGEATVIVSSADRKDNLKGIPSLDSISYNPPKISENQYRVALFTNEKQASLKSYYVINEAIKKKYKLSDTIALGEVNIISRHKDPQTEKIEGSRVKYAKPEAELIISDQMIGYLNILQLLKGKIPGVEVLGDTSIAIRGLGSIQYNQKPLILVDGKQATWSDLFTIPIFLLDRIDILKSSFASNIFGLQASTGVINLITKAGGTGTYRMPAYTSKIRFSGYNAPRRFYSPQHPTDSDTDFKPDLRNTLLWTPYIKLNGDKETILNFYNGDNISKIRISAEGMTTTGIPVTGYAEYEVR